MIGGRYLFDIHDLPTFGIRMRRLFGTHARLTDSNDDEQELQEFWQEAQRLDKKV